MLARDRIGCKPIIGPAAGPSRGIEGGALATPALANSAAATLLTEAYAILVARRLRMKGGESGLVR